jgi:hypothetical protein
MSVFVCIHLNKINHLRPCFNHEGIMRVYTLAAITFAIACASAHAESPVSLEIGIQSGKYNLKPDGTWYQQGLPHVLNIHSYGFNAGLTGTIVEHENWGINWHIDYVNLGHISSTCECTPMDENYNVKTKSLVANPAFNAPLATFVGNGNAQGIAFTIEPYYRYRGVRFSFEGGFFPFRAVWDESIYNWQVNPNTPPQTLHVSTPHSIRPGAVVGIGVGWRNSTVSLKHYWMPMNTSNSPAIFNGATVVEYRYRF